MAFFHFDVTFHNISWSKSIIQIFDTSYLDNNIRQNNECFWVSCISGTLKLRSFHIKAALDPNLQAQIFLKKFLYITNGLNVNSLAYFDSAMTLKINQFPNKDITPYMEILVKSGLHAVHG